MRFRNSDSAPFSIVSLRTFEGMYFSHCDGILSASSWGEIERTMSDFIAYPGVQQWWETRKALAHGGICAASSTQLSPEATEPKAYSTYNLREIVAPETRA